MKLVRKAFSLPGGIIFVVLLGILVTILLAGCGGGGVSSTPANGGFATDTPDIPDPDEGDTIDCIPSPSWEVQLQGVEPATGTVIIAENGTLTEVNANYKNTGEIALGEGISFLPDPATPVFDVTSAEGPDSVAVAAIGTWTTQVRLPAQAGDYRKCFYLGNADGVCAVGPIVCWDFEVTQ